MTTIMDPTDERVPVARQISPRSGQVTGTVALLDISKPRGNVLLDRLFGATLSYHEHGRQENDFIIEGLAD